MGCAAKFEEGDHGDPIVGFRRKDSKGEVGVVFKVEVNKARHSSRVVCKGERWLRHVVLELGRRYHCEVLLRVLREPVLAYIPGRSRVCPATSRCK